METLYRLRDSAGRLLYVGITKHRLGLRLSQHRFEKSWYPMVAAVEAVEYPNSARAAEIAALESESPIFNLMDKPVPARASASFKALAVPEDVWNAALIAAYDRGEDIHDVVTALLRGYARLTDERTD